MAAVGRLFDDRCLLDSVAARSLLKIQATTSPISNLSDEYVRMFAAADPVCRSTPRASEHLAEAGLPREAGLTQVDQPFAIQRSRAASSSATSVA